MSYTNNRAHFFNKIASHYPRFLKYFTSGGGHVSFMAYWCPTSVKIIFMTHKRVPKIFSYGDHTPIVNIFRSDVSPIVQFFVVASSHYGLKAYAWSVGVEHGRSAWAWGVGV